MIFLIAFLNRTLTGNISNEAWGPGFIINKDGFIVTNNHVVENADQITVQLNNGNEFDADIIGRDPNTDIALIKIKPVVDLPFIELGDSTTLKVGSMGRGYREPFRIGAYRYSGYRQCKGPRHRIRSL